MGQNSTKRNRSRKLARQPRKERLAGQSKGFNAQAELQTERDYIRYATSAIKSPDIKPKEVVKTLTKGLKRFPKSAMLHYQHARWCERRAHSSEHQQVKNKHYGLAKESYISSLELEPDSAEVRLDYAFFLSKQEQIHEAEQQFAIAFNVAKDPYRVLVRLGGFYEKTGQIGAAIACYARAKEVCAEKADRADAKIRTLRTNTNLLAEERVIWADVAQRLDALRNGEEDIFTDHIDPDSTKGPTIVNPETGRPIQLDTIEVFLD